MDRARSSVGAAEFLTVPETDGRASVRDVIAALRGAGLASIVCEGGPSLAAQLVAARLVDELCLTTRAVLTPSQLTGFGAGGFEHSELSLTQLLLDEESSLFARWAMAAAPTSGR
jgi:riboflavin biosynthesis pyrimidine reductase